MTQDSTLYSLDNSVESPRHPGATTTPMTNAHYMSDATSPDLHNISPRETR